MSHTVIVRTNVTGNRVPESKNTVGYFVKNEIVVIVSGPTRIASSRGKWPSTTTRIPTVIPPSSRASDAAPLPVVVRSAPLPSGHGRVRRPETMSTPHPHIIVTDAPSLAPTTDELNDIATKAEDDAAAAARRLAALETAKGHLDAWDEHASDDTSLEYEDFVLLKSLHTATVWLALEKRIAAAKMDARRLERIAYDARQAADAAEAAS